MSVYTYADYDLVSQQEQFEYRRGAFLNGYKRRSVTTMTWEATLQDQIPEDPNSHDQGYPGSQNPGNLSTSDGWRLYSVEYSKSLSQPLSKVVRETWIKTGSWETLSD